MEKKWTINADVGEGCDDRLIMPLIDCANIGCGQHAGSPELTEKTVKLAEEYGVTVGAHPSYPDPDNFGRLSIIMSLTELKSALHEQISLVHSVGKKLSYVKPHGALNHDMLGNEDTFSAICEVVASIDASVALMVPTNEQHATQTAIAQSYGLSIWWEVFADRAYEASGLLRPRRHADAVHDNPETIIAQIQRIREHGEIIAVDGSSIDVSNASTICIHGDNDASVRAVQELASSSQEESV